MNRWIRGGVDGMADFLRARLLEDEAEAITQGNTLHGASLQLNVELRRLGVEIAAAARLVPFLQKATLRYADHPDFSEWWRP